MSPSKRKKTPYDQHFISSNATLQYIEEYIQKNFSGVNLFEIGPGKGIITERLLRHCNSVTAIEIDGSLLQYLEELQKQYPDKFKLLHGDAQKLELGEMNNLEDFDLLFSSLPYSIASQLLFKYMKDSKIKEMLFIMQKELANRFNWTNSKAVSAFSIKMRLFVEKFKVIFPIPPHAFKPNPKIDSRFVYIKKREQTPNLEIEPLFQSIDICFMSKRQLLKNNLKRYLDLHFDIESTTAIIYSIYEELKIPITTRAEELSLEQFILLNKQLRDSLGGKSAKETRKNKGKTLQSFN
jgi:16S rRNA (adenine1518-N6/adenine1519-N6)-dimethyltransferase